LRAALPAPLRLAIYIPARRVTTDNPVSALRAD
jgi:hypothetical protein